MNDNNKKPSRNRYPARTRKESNISTLELDRTVWIAGRLIRDPIKGDCLKDFTGVVALGAKVSGTEGYSVGDIVEIMGALESDGCFSVLKSRILAPGEDSPPERSRNRALWNISKDLFDKRRIIKDALRAFFLDRGFIEVETPILAHAPGQEPYLEPFITSLDNGSVDGEEMFLITSPEYFHKRLLSAGFEKIFEIAKVFRNGPDELKGLHHIEFNMVEWYRAYASYKEIMEDVELLIHHLAVESGFPDAGQFLPPFERISMEDAFMRYAGVDLKPFLHNDLSFALDNAEKGEFGLKPSDSLKTRYFKILVGGIEPFLGKTKPVFLVEFPASEASLSKIMEDRPELSERFELYINSVELANGFTELNDPKEQALRFEEEALERSRISNKSLPIDQAFLEALSLGMPPAGGVALGFDRLCMILLNEKDLRSVTPFIDI